MSRPRPNSSCDKRDRKSQYREPQSRSRLFQIAVSGLSSQQGTKTRKDFVITVQSSNDGNRVVKEKKEEFSEAQENLSSEIKLSNSNQKPINSTVENNYSNLLPITTQKSYVNKEHTDTFGSNPNSNNKITDNRSTCNTELNSSCKLSVSHTPDSLCTSEKLCVDNFEVQNEQSSDKRDEDVNYESASYGLHHQNKSKTYNSFDPFKPEDQSLLFNETKYNERDLYHGVSTSCTTNTSKAEESLKCNDYYDHTSAISSTCSNRDTQCTSQNIIDDGHHTSSPNFKTSKNSCQQTALVATTVCDKYKPPEQNKVKDGGSDSSSPCYTDISSIIQPPSSSKCDKQPFGTKGAIDSTISSDAQQPDLHNRVWHNNVQGSVCGHNSSVSQHKIKHRSLSEEFSHQNVKEPGKMHHPCKSGEQILSPQEMGNGKVLSSATDLSALCRTSSNSVVKPVYTGKHGYHKKTASNKDMVKNGTQCNTKPNSSIYDGTWADIQQNSVVNNNIKSSYCKNGYTNCSKQLNYENDNVITKRFNGSKPDKSILRKYKNKNYEMPNSSGNQFTTTHVNTKHSIASTPTIAGNYRCVEQTIATKPTDETGTWSNVEQDPSFVGDGTWTNIQQDSVSIDGQKYDINSPITNPFHRGERDINSETQRKDTANLSHQPHYPDTGNCNSSIQNLEEENKVSVPGVDSSNNRRMYDWIQKQRNQAEFRLNGISDCTSDCSSSCISQGDQEQNGPTGTSGSVSSESLISDAEKECDFGIVNNDQIKAISYLLKNVEDEHSNNILSSAQIKKIVCDINDVLQKRTQGYKIVLYGSYYSGFAMKSSDINLELLTDGHPVTNKFMKLLGDFIRDEEDLGYYVTGHESHYVKKMKVICCEPTCGKKCQIQYLGDGSSVYRTSKLLKKVSELDPRIHTLVTALRHWAMVCKLHNTEEHERSPDEEGRPHPLCYVLMVIHFLQQISPPVVPVINTMKPIEKLEEKNNKCVGELWLELLEYYSTIFNWKDHVISIISLNPVLKETKTWAKCWIGVESPFDEKLNVAKSVRSQDISHFFHMCLRQTYKYFSSPTSYDIDEESSDIESGGRSHNYTFDAENFIGNLTVPTSCVNCAELGEICEDCAEDSETVLEPLPDMTEEFLDILNEALKQVYEEHAMNESDIQNRQIAVTAIEKYIQKSFPNARLEQMGSSASGFGLKNSDLDIIIMYKGKDSLDEEDINNNMRLLTRHLRRNSSEFKAVIALYSAKIPVIQFIHKPSNLRCDLSFYNLLALYNTKLLRMYSLIDDRAKILGCTMKVLAKNACIADTSQNSLSSYSYVLMVIHFLQRTTPPILPVLQELNAENLRPHIIERCNVSFFNDIPKLGDYWKPSVNSTSVGKLWIDMIKYYTEDYHIDEIITIRQNTPMEKCDGFKIARLFNIEDPFIIHKNLGSVMSEQISVKTRKIFLRARKLFGTPICEKPSMYESFKEYLFDPMVLTDGVVRKHIECNICGKLGHNESTCKRYNFNPTRGRGTYRGQRFSNRRGHPPNRGFHTTSRSYPVKW